MSEKATKVEKLDIMLNLINLSSLNVNQLQSYKNQKF